MRAVVVDAVRARPEVREVPDPSRRTAASSSGARDRAVPQRLARLGGPRRDRLPARARPRARRRGRRGRRRGRAVAGRRPGHRPVRLRLRALRVVPGRGRPGLPRPAAARASPTGARSPSTSPCTPPTPTWSPSPSGSTSRRRPSLGCRFATAYRALVGRARVAEGEWVTVVGAGGVGLSAVMIARALGARVVAVDRNPEALAVAAELGAEHTAAGRRHRRAGRRRRPDRRWQPRRRRRGRQRADLRRRRPQPAPPRPPRAGRAAAAGRRPPAGADGAGDRVGARPARQPRDGRGRLPGDAGARRGRARCSRSGSSSAPSASRRPRLLPGFDRATVAGMTMIDPAR